MTRTANDTPRSPARRATFWAIAASVTLLAVGLGGCTTRSSLGWAQTSPTIQPSPARSLTYEAAPIGLAAYGDAKVTSEAR